ERALTSDLRRDPDAHRQALYDLGEIAGGVVGRQQREHRARGRRHALDHALYVVARQRVDCDRDVLAGLDAGELRLLELRVNVDALERHQAQEPGAGLHVVADLNGAVADHAVEGRADLGEGEIALRLGQRGREL